MSKKEKIKFFFHKYAVTILVAAILFYIAIFFGISYWKYNNFAYNSLDLAIFNQVFYNTSHGRLFQLSIHAPTYLGDHLAPIILVLSLFYSIYRSPLTLLFLQTVILALTAFPVYFIAKKVIKDRIWALIMGIVWLLNPLVQNANLFEFHLLPFAVFFLLWTFCFYLEKKWKLVFFFSFLSLLVREDVSLVLFMFGVLIVFENFKILKLKDYFHNILKYKTKKLIDKIDIKFKVQNSKDLFFGIIICFASAIWLFFSLKIIGNYAQEGNYKFLIYYLWLGNSVSEIILSVFTKPLQIFVHLISIANFEMILGLLLSFIFLPIFGRKYLILLVGPLFQLMIGAPSGSALILQTHYNMLMIPALMIGAVYGIKYFLENPVGQNSRFDTVKILTHDKKFLFIIFTVGIIYNSLFFGPLFGSAYEIVKNSPDKNFVKVKKEFLNKIPPNASVATTYEFLNNLSSRQKIYSMHYLFIGKKQFSDIDYQLPIETEYLLIDFDDFFIYNIQFPDHAIYSPFFNIADNNMRELLSRYKLIDIYDNLALFKLSSKKEVSNLYKVVDYRPKYEQKIELEGKVNFLGWQINEQVIGEQGYDELIPLSLFWQAKSDLSSGNKEIPSINYQLKMLVIKDNETVYEKFYPLAYNIFPTSDWLVDEVVQTNYWFYIPKEFALKNNVLHFSLTQVDGFLELNDLRQAKPNYTEKFLRPSLTIDRIEVLK